MKTALKQTIHVSALMLFLIGWATAARGAGAQWGGYSYGGTVGKSGNCLSCHGIAANVGRRNFIDPVRYDHTTHAKIGCPACHDALDGTHPDGSQGKGKADCRYCHDDISAEYAASSHGKNASCGGCHDPHRVNTPSEISAGDTNKMCAKCHDSAGVAANHTKWLPRADLHMEMLPCVTCHTGSRNYVINLYIIKRQEGDRHHTFDLATHDELQKLAGSADILSLIDVNGDNYVSIDELRNFNRNPAYRGLRLKGMMTPEQASHSFQILDNRRNCTFCHASGPGTMQTSFIALPEKNGAFRRVAVERGAVLDALNGTPDFYMTGKTRNATLDKIGLLIVAGGMVMPVGHGFLRLLSRNIRNKKGKENRHE